MRLDVFQVDAEFAAHEREYEVRAGPASALPTPALAPRAVRSRAMGLAGRHAPPRAGACTQGREAAV
jgi:hypothetical protein